MIKIDKENVSKDDNVIATVRRCKLVLTIPIKVSGKETDFEVELFYDTEIEYDNDGMGEIECGNELSQVRIDKRYATLVSDDRGQEIVSLLNDSLVALCGEKESSKNIKQAVEVITDIIQQEFEEFEIEI